MNRILGCGRHRAKSAAVLAVMASLCAAIAAHTADWRDLTSIRAEQLSTEHKSGNLEFRCRWAPDRGINLRIAPPNGRRRVELRLTKTSGDMALEPEDAFPMCVLPGSQFDPSCLPADPMDSVRVLVKFRPETWCVYVDNLPAAVFPAPFMPPATVSAPDDILPPDSLQDIYFQEVDDFVFEDDFLREEDADDLPGWTVETGSWHLHTAAELTVEGEDVKKGDKKRPQPGYSPNFYSLKGGGANALLTAGYAFRDSYIIAASLHVSTGEMGVVTHFTSTNDYYAFTVTPDDAARTGLFRFRRVRGSGPSCRETLGAVRAELTLGQWIELSVKSYQNRIECRVGHTKVLDMPVQLPPGGKYGLYCDGSDEARFDDVSARTNHDMDFRGMNELRRCALEEHGMFFPRRRFLRLFPARRIGNELEPYVSRDPQWLALGSASHRAHVFSADFVPAGDKYEMGLLAGYTSADNPYYRFICEHSPEEEKYVLERVSGKTTETLEQFRPDAALTRTGDTIRLMCDAAERDELRLYCNGQLVLIHHPTGEIGGASGVFVGPETSVKIRDPEYTFARADVYVNRDVQNPKFVEDPYMRHWSSPEGQWIEHKISEDKSVIWHKSDFFGRYDLTLPYVPGSTIHLGVPSDETNGTVRISETDTQLIFNIDGTDSPVRPAVTNLAEMTVPSGRSGKPVRQFTVHYEDYWLRATSGGRTLFKKAIQRRMQGTRIMLEGYDADRLSMSRVRRYNVLDVLFRESLHDWIMNGGRWDVVNRFQCQPRWSHMNGQSPDGIAALWSKYDLRGDFCVEMYAGMRHGWYRRAGDLNLTVMNDSTTPSRGYTVTCAGWDPDWSQLYTRLYRNGALFAESDKYCVPRSREGNERRGYTPWIKGGRPIHGAWYYIKFRRAGKTLEYYFDNELVFRVDDENPLQSGSAGLWTFMNSMVVARVQIAAESIEPRRMPFTEVNIETEPAGSAGEFRGPDESRLSETLLCSGRPASMMAPSLWRCNDDTGRGLLTWHGTMPGDRFFEFRNVLGSGKMFVESTVPPALYGDLSGWEFELKRTSNAQFNFHYSIGQLNGKGEYIPGRLFFFRVSGTDSRFGPRIMHGHADIAPVSEPCPGWHARGDWSKVRVILPAGPLREYSSRKDLLVRLEGFGNLQPGIVQQGLTGNGPGESYAVRGFREIRYGKPVLSVASNAAGRIMFTAIDAKTRNRIFAAPDIGPVQAWISDMDGTGLMNADLEIGDGTRSATQQVTWIAFPAEPRVSCAWSASYPAAVDLVSDTDWPDRRVSFAGVAVDGVRVEPDVNGERMTLRIPRDRRFTTAVADDLSVAVEYSGGGSTNFTLAVSDRPVNDAPVLLDIKGPGPLFENFERRNLAKPLNARSGHMKLIGDVPGQGTVLKVFNAGVSARLRAAFDARCDLSSVPLCRFRYRAAGMANVSLSLGSAYCAAIGERCDRAVKTRYAPDYLKDNTWHTWMGMISDAAKGERPLDMNMLSISTVTFGSHDREDQTGRYTEWHVDDIALGPAISRGEQLAFTPGYFDFDGVARVFMSVYGGVKGYHELDDAGLTTLKWDEIGNGTRTVPDVNLPEDGVCHLLLKAVDVAGMESGVTDIPFLLDRRPVDSVHAFKPSSNPECNGSILHVAFGTHGGAPLALARLGVKWDDMPVDLATRGSTYRHSADGDILELNWPYIFREQLNDSSDGETHNVTITGITDGAGNKSPDHIVPITIDYASDTNPPTVLGIDYPANVFWCSRWSEPGSGIGFRADKHNETRVVTDDGEPYLCTQSHKNTGGISLGFRGKNKWHPADHPYISFRIRRPVISKADAELKLVLAVMSGKKERKYEMLLAGAGAKREDAGGENETIKLAFPEPIDWQSNTWHAVTLNIGELLAGAPDTTEDNGEKTRGRKTLVKSLSFERRRVKDKTPLHLQSLFIYSAWDPSDTMDIDAFDAGGMAGTLLEYEGESRSMKVGPETPAGLSSGWMMVSARDNAGNISVPVRVPFVVDRSAEPADPGAKEEQ